MGQLAYKQRQQLLSVMTGPNNTSVNLAICKAVCLGITMYLSDQRLAAVVQRDFCNVLSFSSEKVVSG
jgi:hypothetical protein